MSLSADTFRQADDNAQLRRYRLNEMSADDTHPFEARLFVDLELLNTLQLDELLADGLRQLSAHGCRPIDENPCSIDPAASVGP